MVERVAAALQYEHVEGNVLPLRDLAELREELFGETDGARHIRFEKIRAYLKHAVTPAFVVVCCHYTGILA